MQALRLCVILAKRSTTAKVRRPPRVRPRRAALLAGTVVAFASGDPSSPIAEQVPGVLRLVQRSEPQLLVAPSIVTPPASQVALSIDAFPADALPKYSFVRVRGLPPFVSLSEGYSVGSGSWAVPLQGLAKLKANVAAGVSTRAELVVALVSVEGTVLAQTTTVLIVKAPAADLALGGGTPPREGAGVLAPQPPPRRGSGPPEAAAAQQKQAEQLLAQGERYLAQGALGGARLFFRQASDAGLATAAMRLGATYDPAELGKLQVRGLVADAAEARKWYERARELGAPDAEQRLARLGNP
jgi:hypothetical protein